MMKMRYVSLILLLVGFGCKNQEHPTNSKTKESINKSIANEKQTSDSIYDTWEKHYAFVAEKKIFDSLHNNMIIAKDLNSVNLIASQMENQFINSTNSYIQRQLPKIFNDGYYNFIDKNGRKLEDQIRCVQMNDVHPKLCKLCLNDATRKLMRNQKVQEAYDLYLSVADKEELNLSQEDERSYSVVEKYLSEIKKENTLGIPQDSFEYKKVLEAENVCLTKWLSGEWTDMSLMQAALSNFILKFPNSELKDDAAYLRLGMDIDGEGGLQPDELDKLIKLLKTFLKDYPHSNYKEKAWDRIIQNTYKLKGRNAEYITEVTQYLKEFPDGRLADDYQYYLNQAKEGSQ